MAHDSGHRRLLTAGTVIEALGGTTAVARLTGRSVSQISNMKGAGKFAPALFLVMTTALAANGATAPASLWRQVEPRRPRVLRSVES